MAKISETFFTSFQTSLLQDRTVKCVKKMFFLRSLVLVLKMAVWGAILVKT